MDILSDVLKSLKTSGTVYFCDQLEAPWTKEFPASETAAFHQVRRGNCWFYSREVVEYLGPGDLIFLGPGTEHYLSSDKPGGSEPGEAGALLLCGYCEFTANNDTPMYSLFPSHSLLRDEDLQKRPWLKEIMSQLSAEFMSMDPGSALVVEKLTDVLIIELIRINFGQQQQSQLLRALADKHIAKALHRIHSNPEQPWTLESLSADIGLSRAAFAKKFKILVGASMFDYLTQLRMTLAKELLRDTDLLVYLVAQRVGYESELAFTKTFKKRMGITPFAYRKQEN